MMPVRSFSLVTAVFFVVCLLGPVISPLAARQPELELPPWIELSLRFTEPPELGRPVHLVGEALCLLGAGEKARMKLVPAEGMQVLSGRDTVDFRLSPGRRRRLVLVVRVLEPVEHGRVGLVVSSETPRGSIEAALRGDKVPAALLRRRLDLLKKLPDRLEASRRLSFRSSRIEAAFGERMVRPWKGLVAGPGGKGRFITALSRGTEGDLPALKGRIRAFESNEALLRKRPKLRRLILGRMADARAAAVAGYGENLLALATRLFGRRPSRTGSFRAFFNKASAVEGMPSDLLAALENYLALSHLFTGELKDAASWWSSLVEDRTIDDAYRAYALYNTGEALRITGRPDDGAECFRAALRLRPGLSIAYEGLRSLGVLARDERR